MPSYKGKYFLKGSSARAAMQRDESGKSGPTDAMPEDQPTDKDESIPSHKIEVHKHDDQSYHTITLHDDGNRTREDHPDLNAVKDHLDAHMQSAQDGMADNDDDYSLMKESATGLPSIKGKSGF